MAIVTDTKTGKIYKYKEVDDDLYQDYQQCYPNKQIKVTDIYTKEEKELPILQCMLYAIYRNTIGLFRK
jgi:hypothetical protein